MPGMDEALAIQHEQMLRMRDFLGPQVEAVGQAMTKRDSKVTFKNPKAKQFHVDGTKIPEGEYLLLMVAADRRSTPFPFSEL